MKRWYLKIKFKEKHDGRKVWYMNDGYLCDCINLPFKDKTECESYIPELKAKYKDKIKKISVHWTR